MLSSSSRRIHSLEKSLLRRSESCSRKCSPLPHNEPLPRKSIFLAGLGRLVSSALLFFTANLPRLPGKSIFLADLTRLISSRRICSSKKSRPRRSKLCSLERSPTFHYESLPRKSLFFAGLNRIVSSALRFFTAIFFRGTISPSQV